MEDVLLEEAFAEDSRYKWRFLSNHFVRILSSMYREDIPDDNIQIPYRYHREHATKRCVNKIR